ncbi:MAG: chorismate-binding protein [Candidatus Bathyarchaeota archaeon]|nr:MAG: chorismate-binding protein [Candidatus Bathyarchaeota archaeon]
MAKCPKCEMEIASPRKTWKMAGRPDKKGKRLELQIGLYDCPKHGAFRSVLSKRKI